MAGTSLFALLDDIASILDDVSLMTKVAAKKTAGVLGDDLALNAQQVSGVRAERELPVVWAVALGSLKNKAILVPAALAISAFAPWAITPLLMVGGAYLCFEGFEKIAHPVAAPGRQPQGRAGRSAARPEHRPGRAGKRQDQGRRTHRFHFVGRNHRDCAGHGGHRHLRRTGGGGGRHRRDHDGGRVRPGGRHRQARRRRVLPGRAQGRRRADEWRARRWAACSSPPPPS